MRPLMLIVPAAMALAALASPGQAATAHNSQAGAYGPTKNVCAATPYFPAGEGCVSSYLSGNEDLLPGDDDVHGRYRPRKPLE